MEKVINNVGGMENKALLEATVISIKFRAH